MEDPLLPGEFGLFSRTSTINEGLSLMAGLINRTMVNVSWLACVTGDGRYLCILSSTCACVHDILIKIAVINKTFTWPFGPTEST